MLLEINNNNKEHVYPGWLRQLSLEKLLSMQFLRIKIQLKKLKGNTKNYLIYYKYELRLTINALHAFGSFKASGI